MANIKRNQLTTLKVKHAKPGVHTDGGGADPASETHGWPEAGYSGSRLTARYVKSVSVGIHRLGSKDARQLAQELTRCSSTRTRPCRPT